LAAFLWLALSVFLVIRPSPQQDWAVIMENARPLKWVFGLPVVFVFGTPLLSARRVLKDERLKRGVSYQFFGSWNPHRNLSFKIRLLVGSDSPSQRNAFRILSIHQAEHRIHASQQVFREHPGRSLLT
jgi:hypothetical protein